MSWVVWARVAPAVALLPLGALWARLLLAGGLALFLSTHLPVEAAFTAPALVAELALGALLGVLAGLPVHAARGLRGAGPPALDFAGRVWAWAIFFAIGGPALWAGALAQSFVATPPWPDLPALTEAGGALFYAALVLGLPTWLVHLTLGPLGAWADRLGRARHGATLMAARPLLALVALVALLPLLLDVLRTLWLEALS